MSIGLITWVGTILSQKNDIFVASLLNEREGRYSSQLANKQVFCSSLIAAAWAAQLISMPTNITMSISQRRPLPGKLIIIDQLISRLDGKRQKLPASLSSAKKHFFKKASWRHRLLARSGHLSTALNGKWKCDGWLRSSWKSCRGASPWQPRLIHQRRRLMETF